MVDIEIFIYLSLTVLLLLILSVLWFSPTKVEPTIQFIGLNNNEEDKYKVVDLIATPSSQIKPQPEKSQKSPPLPKKQRVNKKYKFQEKCREIFQTIFKVPFDSIRPNWLMNPLTGQNLELDGYNESLNLAFEYDGIQHSKFSKFAHKNDSQFIYQIKKDDFKTKKLKELNIDLIRIPYFIVFEELESYIKSELTKIDRLPS